MSVTADPSPSLATWPGRSGICALGTRGGALSPERYADLLQHALGRGVSHPGHRHDPLELDPLEAEPKRRLRALRSEPAAPRRPAQVVPELDVVGFLRSLDSAVPEDVAGGPLLDDPHAEPVLLPGSPHVRPTAGATLPATTVCGARSRLGRRRRPSRVARDPPPGSIEEGGAPW